MPEPSRKARPVTQEWLFRAAAHYFERYASSTENLRRVLERKVRRRADARGEDAGDFGALVEATVARFVELKLVDDEAYAQARLASLRRRGTSRRMAAAKLIEKGVARDLVAATLERDETGERQAASAYARRRRLGPYRTRDRAERRDRDVAAMVRAGFAFPIAAATVDGPADDCDAWRPPAAAQPPGKPKSATMNLPSKRRMSISQTQP